MTLISALSPTGHIFWPKSDLRCTLEKGQNLGCDERDCDRCHRERRGWSFSLGFQDPSGTIGEVET